MQKGFGLIGILIVVGIIAGMGAFVLTSVFPDKNPFVPSPEEKSAIEMAEQMKNILEQKNIEITPPTSTSKDETADWKTYRNEEYGFEFKYPVDMDVVGIPGEEIDFVVNIKEGTKDLVNIFVFKKYPSFYFDVNKETYVYQTGGEPVPGTWVEESNCMQPFLGNLEIMAIKEANPSFGVTHFLFSNKSVTFAIQSSLENSEEMTAHERMSDAVIQDFEKKVSPIFKTFKFIGNIKSINNVLCRSVNKG